MKDDITRNTFGALKHFSSVLMQQGRVQLDADWNEQVAIHHHFLRRFVADVIGPCGGPIGNGAFTVQPLGAAAAPGAPDFALSPGHYYVDGILCELDTPEVAVTGFPGQSPGSQIAVAYWTAGGVSFQKGQYVQLYDADPAATTAPATLLITDTSYNNLTLTVAPAIGGSATALKKPRVQRVVTLMSQPDYPVVVPPPALSNGSYHVYLDVWERLITYVEDDSIREVALNGPDTAGRAKIVWQVKVLPAGANAARTCMTPQGLYDLLQPFELARLRARAKPPQTSGDPCTIAPDALYRGPENQCYRVEIHTGSVAADGSAVTPTFKWSRENGSVVYPIRSGDGTNALVLESLGRDDRFGLKENDFVEVQDDDFVLANRVTPLLTVASIDRSRMTVVLTGTPDPAIGTNPAKHPLLRRWDHVRPDASSGGPPLGPDNAVQVPIGAPGPATWLDLEDGVQVQFSNPAATLFRPGDYWLIPARVATGDVEWPSETVDTGQGNIVTQKVFLPPLGIVHHYAPLAVITVGENNTISSVPCQTWFSQLQSAAKVIAPQPVQPAQPQAKGRATRSAR